MEEDPPKAMFCDDIMPDYVAGPCDAMMPLPKRCQEKDGTLIGCLVVRLIGCLIDWYQTNPYSVTTSWRHPGTFYGYRC